MSAPWMVPMSEAQYARYLRAWRRYLELPHERWTAEDLCWQYLQQRLAPPYNEPGLQRWPLNWPQVEMWFGSCEAFIEAIEHLPERTN